MTIISHKYKMIHFHNPKCGGTSFEVSLSKYLGNDDIISEQDENYRKKYGFKNARNHKMKTYKFYIRHDTIKRFLINIRSIFFWILSLIRFSNNREIYFYSIFFHKDFIVGRHTDPERILNLFPYEYEQYMKICVLRNPINQLVSLYRYRRGKPIKADQFYAKFDTKKILNFEEFVELTAEKFFKVVQNITGLTDTYNHNINYIKYEKFDQEIIAILDQCNIPHSFLTTFKNIRLRDSNTIFKKPFVSEKSKAMILNFSKFLAPYYPELYTDFNKDDLL